MNSRETVLNVLRAIGKNDIDSIRSLVSSQFIWHVPGISPISGDVEGVDNWSNKLHLLLELGLQVTIESILFNDHTVITVQHNQMVGEASQLDQRVLTIYQLVEGTIVRMDTVFTDQYQADEHWRAVFP
jgi:ketosteroid isomerase-like protein